MLESVLALLQSSFEIFRMREPGLLRATVIVAGLLAVACWIVCSRYWQLWNLRFQMKLQHHVLCAAGAIVTLVFAIVFQTLRFAEDAADRSIARWQAEVRSDENWANRTFRQAWFEVQGLGVEDFTDKADPGEPGAMIPINHDESRRVAAQAYSDAACRHFSARRPFLSKVIWARPALPSDVVIDDIANWQATTNEPYSSARAIDLVAERVRLELRPQLPRLVGLSRAFALALFLLGQAIPFCSIGFAAYRDLREQV